MAMASICMASVADATSMWCSMAAGRVFLIHAAGRTRITLTVTFMAAGHRRPSDEP